MTRTPRPDLLDALLRSCWTVEAARANVLRGWGGEYEADGDAAAERADIMGAVCRERGLDVSREILDGHTAWLRSLAGDVPDRVPLGPGVVHRLAAWTDVYAVDYLGGEAERFKKLGQTELRMPIPPRHMEPHEAAIPQIDPGPGERFVIFTDIHIGARATEELAQRAVQDINALEPRFVLIPGDITDDGELPQFERAKVILDELNAPYHAVLGNHDVVRRSTTAPDGHRLFEEVFGTAPVDTVIECGPLQLALMDTTDPEPSPFPDWDLARGGFRDDAGGTNGGALRPGQAQALADRLDRDRPTLVVCHHELQPFCAFPPVMFGVRDEDSRELAESLRDHRLLGIVAGHTHRSALTTVEGRIAQLEIPSLKDWPFAFTVVTVTDEAVRVTVRQLSDPDLVWEHVRQVPPIYLGYVLGPESVLGHTFPLRR